LGRDLVKLVNGFSDSEVEALLKEYAEVYDFAENLRSLGRARFGKGSGAHRTWHESLPQSRQFRAFTTTLKICTGWISFLASLYSA